MNTDSPRSEPGETAKSDKADRLDILRRRIPDVHWRWHCWKQLFVDDEDRKFGLMDASAMYLFVVIQQALFDDVVLRVCKLADPPEGGPNRDRRENLTLEWLIEDAQRRGDPRADAARKLLGTLRSCIAPLKKMRDRAIAHEDLRTTLHIEQLDPVQYETLDRALAMLVDIAKELEDPSANPSAYNLLLAPGDGEMLLSCLARAECLHRLHMVLLWLHGLPAWAKRMKQQYPALAAEFDNLPPLDLLETLRQNEPWPGARGFPA